MLQTLMEADVRSHKIVQTPVAVSRHPVGGQIRDDTRERDVNYLFYKCPGPTRCP